VLAGGGVDGVAMDSTKLLVVKKKEIYGVAVGATAASKSISKPPDTIGVEAVDRLRRIGPHLWQDCYLGSWLPQPVNPWSI